MEWIEQIFHVSPDAGNGSLELLLILWPLVAFLGRLPDADMVRRSHDKTEGSKEIGSLEQSTTLVPLGGKKGSQNGQV